MAYTLQPETTKQASATTWHWVSAILAVLGVLAASFGAWLAFGPENATLNLFGWTWSVADLSEMWAPFLMIGGGVITTLSMGIESARDWDAEASRWLVGLELLVAAAGVAAVIVGIILLF